MQMDFKCELNSRDETFVAHLFLSVILTNIPPHNTGGALKDFKFRPRCRNPIHALMSE